MAKTKDRDNRGGPRKGAGRKPIPNKVHKVTTSVFIEPALRDRLITRYGSLSAALIIADQL
jgi:hypothetical protein